MQRVIYALVALITLFPLAPRPTRAQDVPAKPAEPAGASQRSDGHAATGSTTPLDPAEVPAAAAEAGVYLLPADKTVDNIVAHDKRLILEGHVTHDVLAIDCDVVIKPKAEVGNYVNVIGGTVTNEAGDDVKVIHQDSGLAPGLMSLTEAASPDFGEQRDKTKDLIGRPARRQSWSGGQFALWLLGMLSGLILYIVAPRAVQRTSEVVAMERGRCLAYGILGALAMSFLLLCGAVLLKLPLGLLLSPFVAALAVGCGIVLAYGWLCGMAQVGLLLQRKFNWAYGSWFKQVAFGLTAFFVANLILGGISAGLGVTALCVEGIIALMGLGAALMSGFGTDPNWLSARWRGEIGWFTRSPRL